MLDEYTRKTKQNEEDCNKFLGFKDKKKEKDINRNIENVYENIINNYLTDKISKCEIRKENIKPLVDYIIKIINTLSPTFRYLKDSMNINDYIKVKIIKYKDFSLSKVVAGFVMTKNVCSKKMREKQENPKILLLDLDLNEHKTKEPLKTNNEVSKESFQIEDFKKKIELLDISVILLNKGIGNLLLETLLKNSKLIIIVNVKSSSLRKIARCTKGQVIYSLNKFLEFDVKCNSEKNVAKLSSNIFGMCQSFQITNISNFEKKEIKNRKCIIEDFSLYNNPDFGNIILSKNNKLMTFDGCSPILFQTLILSGPDRAPLNQIKVLLKNEIFSTAHEYYLQKNVLYFLFCSIPPIIKEKKTSINEEYKKNENNKIANFEISRGISNDIKIKRNTENIKELIMNPNNLYLSKDIKNKIISEEIDNKIKLERKISNNVEIENKNINNISLIEKNLNISNDSQLNKDQIEQLNKIINNMQINKNDLLNNKRNSSNIIISEKDSYNSYSNTSNINNESSKALFEKNKEKIKINLNLNNIKLHKNSSENNENKTLQLIEKMLNNKNDLNLSLGKTSSEWNKNKSNIPKKTSNKIISKKNKEFDGIIKGTSKSVLLNDLETIFNDEMQNGENSSYKFGFDISPIITNKSSINFIRLTMCKGDSQLNNINNISNSENSFENKNKNSPNINSLTENAVLKSLNFICEEMEIVNLVYYKSKYREGDKSLAKLVIDNISEIDKPLEKIIRDNLCEKNKYLSEMINNLIEEKDKFLSKMIIDILTERNNCINYDIISERVKYLSSKIIDVIVDEEVKNSLKNIFDVIAEKDKILGKTIIDTIEGKDKILIDDIDEKEKIFGRKIIENLEKKKSKNLCKKLLDKKIIDKITEKDKKIGKMILDIITEKDKPLGKMIIDMTAEKDNKCNKCKSIMNNHFYFLYNSNFSRIKIEFLSNSDINLEKAINYINIENANFKNNFGQTGQNQLIDYNVDIFSYGFCKKCKEIVTPLTKMPKDLYNYSAAKFFKHFFNNEILNRDDLKEFNLSSSIGEKKCNHSSFHDINRIFITKYGALKFQYENLRKYDLISIQNTSDKKIVENFQKEINVIEIINIIKENLKQECDEIKNMLEISQNNNLTIMPNFQEKTNIIKIINDLIDYLKDDSREDSINGSSKSIKSILNNTNLGNKSDIENNNSLKEKESVDKKKKVSQIKCQTISNEGSSETWEEIRKMNNLSKSPSEVDKKFINSVNHLLSINYEDLIKNEEANKSGLSIKFESYFKRIDIKQKIYFKIAQIKVLYNKIRTIINILKIIMSLELILKDEEKKYKLNSKKNNNIINEINAEETKNNNNNKEGEEEKNDTSEIDSIKSKTPKIKPKVVDKIIANNNPENDPRGIFGHLDLENNYSNNDNIDRKSTNVNLNNNAINVIYNNNNENSEVKIKKKKNSLETEDCPFPRNPKTIYKSEDFLAELEKKVERNQNDIINKEQNINNEIKEEKNVTDAKINLDKNEINKENIEEEKIELSPDMLIKLLIDKYVNIFKETEKYEKIESNVEYSKLLKAINFCDQQTKDFPSLIKETDLSSIVSYAISSFQYGKFMKEKTNLLGIKRNLETLPNLNLTQNSKKEIINLEKTESESKTDEETSYINKEDQFLYNTLLLFDSSNFNYILEQSLDSNSSQLSKKKNININRMLEAEILCKDTEHFIIKINSLNEKKFEAKSNPSRKMTISSRQTIGNQSPIFSPPQSNSSKTYEKIYEKTIESEIEQIEQKISKFYTDVNKMKEDIKNINKLNKLENISKQLNIDNNPNLLNNMNPEELFPQNNNSSNGNFKKKREILVNFCNSFNNSKLKKEVTQEFAKKPNSKENVINFIEKIGKLYFKEDLLAQSEIEVIIYYPRQFEALRIAYCCTYEDLINSITRSREWTDVSGGKSKASFYKTNDEKYLFKSINKNEFTMFLEIAFYYFQHIDEYLFHKMPSVLMKILGVYKIKIKKIDQGETKVEYFYLMMMENLNYGINGEKKKIKTYDLKGSTINRYIQKKEKKEKNNLVLLDTNFKKDFNNEPIPLKKDLYGLLLVSVYNDTLFLSKMGNVDYSLLLYINDTNENNKDNAGHSLIRVGIIDYIRKYTWDKKIEHFVKTIINGFNSPTIINPSDYKERFFSAIKSYFIGI